MVPIGPAGDRWCPAGTVLYLTPPGYQVTPMMEGLDDEARSAIAYAKLKVWGRYPWPYGLHPPGYRASRLFMTRRSRVPCMTTSRYLILPLGRRSNR